MIVLCGMSHAQYFSTIYVPEWTGPKRAWIAGGMVQRIGTPDFDSWGSSVTPHPDAFVSPMNMNLSIGLDLESGSDGLSTGPYFHFDFSKDSWSAEFNSELPTGYSPLYVFQYDMTCMHVGGAFGWGLYYHVGEMFEFGLGGGIYLMGSVKTQYSSTITRKADGYVMPQTDDPWEFGGPTHNPMNIGVDCKFDMLYYFADDIYVGLQARCDAYPFYCSLDDTKNFVGQSLVCSDNNRPRIVAMLTLGARW